ncbi:MAG: ATP-binding protein, partial [Pseudomonadota bacterium]
RSGALAGLGVGFAVWLYCLFLPSFGPSGILPQTVFDNGLFGQAWLRPYALFGTEGMDRVIHAVMWSMLLNAGAFILVSIVTLPQPIERLQGAQFVNVFDHSATPGGWSGGLAQSEDLLIMTQRIMGAGQAQALFSEEARRQGLGGYLPEPSPDFLNRLERELSGSIGAAAAHAMISQIVGRATVSVEDLMAVADETAQIMEYSSRLEAKTDEQARTARQLREANEKLTQISVQKDAFLSQISHELRTPMTSIRSFSEILRETDNLTGEERNKYAKIIQDEATRLTRLLDDLLDLSVLENGQVVLNRETGRLEDLLDRAIAAADATGQVRIRRNLDAEQVPLHTDLDRLTQVFINLISNTRKYCETDDPELTIKPDMRDGDLVIDFIDNGDGIPRNQQAVIFEKFARVGDTKAGGAGLGLAICREVMGRLGGSITYVPGQAGAAFRVRLPLESTGALQAAQ